MGRGGLPSQPPRPTDVAAAVPNRILGGIELSFALLYLVDAVARCLDVLVQFNGLGAD